MIVFPTGHAPVLSGVPQVSILGHDPLLVVLHINDLPHINLNFCVEIFADDVALYHSIRNCLVLQHDLNTLYVASW